MDARDPIARLWEKVDRSGGPDSCWPWRGARNDNGYGIIRVRGRNLRTHRLALGLELALAREPFVLHSCDNPPCCNPAHLSVGTQADNVHDMLSKGRRRYVTRLSAAQVAGIRDAARNGATQGAIASEYGLSQSYVSMIVSGARAPGQRGV